MPMPDARCRMQEPDADAGYRTLVAGCGYWLLRINLRASYKWVSCPVIHSAEVTKYILFSLKASTASK
jgi:hypothetical protein